MLSKGIFVISLDVELAWGTRDKIRLFNNNKEYYLKTREIIKKLLDLFKQYKISATWGIVGHLFLNNCSAKNGIKHPEIIRPQYNWYKKDWFDDDPCTNLNHSPIWYGQDIMEAIKGCPIKQEIGSHTFSHIILGDKGCSKECAESEIKQCVILAQNHGIGLKSFIFPRNIEGHWEILKNYGFACYRGLEPYWFLKFKNSKIRNTLYFFDYLFSLTPPVGLPKEKLPGLWNIPGSMLYVDKAGIKKVIPISTRVKKALKGINQAILKKKVFHLWFHPFNLATDPDGLLNGLEDIIKYACQERNRGNLEILTMDRIAELMNQKR